MNRKLLVAVSLLALVSACKRNESPPLLTPPQVQENPSPANSALPPGHPSIAMEPQAKDMPALPPPPMPSAADAIQWELPTGWAESRPGGMRFATLKPPVPGKIDVSVIMLPGAAGGELGNVNRWRGQIGLPPIDEAGRAHVRKEVKSKAGGVSLYDFAGEGPDKQRMLAGLLFANDKSWFFKMVGDSTAVEAARPDFVKFLGNLHFPAGK